MKDMDKKTKLGRPADEHALRYMLRHHASQLDVWRVAAATCGMTVAEWIRSTLDAESARATHVPLAKRRAAR